MERKEDAEFLLSEFPFLESLGRNRILLRETGRLPELLRVIADRRLSILRLEQQEATLEDLFLEVVGE